MATCETIVPFIFHFAAGLPAGYISLPLEEQFELARRTGWSEDPDDPGGATMIDVTLKTYSQYKLGNSVFKKKGHAPTKDDLKRITFDEWMEILKSGYWNLWRADEILSQGIAHLLVDWVWASGPKSIRSAQRIIGVKPDGIVGPITIKVLNDSNSDILFSNIINFRRQYYADCKGAWKFLKGWLRRLNSIQPDGTFIL